MLLPDKDGGAGGTDAGSSNRVLARNWHLFPAPKAPGRAIHWTLLEEEDRPGHGFQECVQVLVISCLALKNQRISGSCG